MGIKSDMTSRNGDVHSDSACERALTVNGTGPGSIRREFGSLVKDVPHFRTVSLKNKSGIPVR